MIGKLKSEISLLTEQRLVDGGGGALVTWAMGPSFLAEIVWRRSAAEKAGLRQRFKRRARVTIRARDDVTFATRLKIAGAQFSISSIISSERDEGFLVLETEEVLL